MSTRRPPVSPSTRPTSGSDRTAALMTTRPGPKKRGGVLRLFLLLCGLAGVATVSATTGALLAMSLSGPTFSQWKPSNPEEAAAFNRHGESISQSGLQLPQLTRPVNILIMGIKVTASDVDDHATKKQYGYDALINSFEGLSDTMLLVRFDPGSGKLSVLSIPRDTRTWIEGMGMTKINAANVKGGPAASARATSELLDGLPIDRYVRINVQGVEKLVDALGGVTLYVPKDMKYQDDSQHLYINLKAGKQHLNGSKALQFLRYRHDEYGDIGRVQRQQMAIRAFKEQVMNPATILRLPKILSTIRENVDTNLSLEEIVALAGFSSHVERSDVQMMMLPGEFGENSLYGGISYWLPNRTGIRDVLSKFFGQGEPASPSQDASRLRIALQNTTKDEAATQAVAKLMDQAQYPGVFKAKAWPETLATTQIVAQNGNRQAAEQVRSLLGFGEVRVDSTGYLESDITVQIGRDWQAALKGRSPAASP